MFGKKKSEMTETENPGQETAKEAPKAEKLSGPQSIPDLVERYLEGEKKMDRDWLRNYKAVLRPREGKAFAIRIFDEIQSTVKKVSIKDYTSLDSYPGLLMYEGWFDKDSKKVELEEKEGLKIALEVSKKVPILSKDEILQKIEALSQPGSTVFFYLAGSPAYGGPLGRGAAVVELNPDAAKKGKKYILYTADVDGMTPVGKGQKFFESDKAKDIASWIKDRHHETFASRG